MTAVLDLSARELARRMRHRDLSPVEVVEAHIARIEAVDGPINAVVVPRYEAARREAEAAQARILRDPVDSLPPLLGVPCTVKEFVGMAGMPNTAGMIPHRGRVAAEDATVVQRLRAAGAIVLGLTNVPEGGLYMETDNRLYGRTVNPWDPRRTPGGSSGGEGAVVAYGGSPFGVGADIGGSIRLPAAFCGTVGHKPTGRMVPSTGHFPLPHRRLLGMLALGPLARRVEDIALLLPILAGPDGRDPCTRTWRLGDPAAVRPEDLVVHVADTGRLRVQRSMQQGVRDAASALGAAGASVRPLALRGMDSGLEIWAAALAESPESYAEILGGGRRISPLRELARRALDRSDHTIPALMMALTERLTALAPRRARRMLDVGRALGVALEAALGDRGVLLFPPYTRPAPRHYTPLLTPFDAGCTALFNVLELPVTVVPVGRDPAGLPICVQVVAGRGRDHLAIAAAQVVESATGGWVRAEPGRAR